MKRHFSTASLWILLFVVSVALGTGCSTSKRLQTSGIANLQVGGEMLPPETQRWKRHAVRDTMYLEGGYTWRASILQYKAGKVYVESDFMGQETINRIRVESSDIQMKNGQMVGMTVGSLLTTATDWQVTYLSDYGLLDAISLYQPSVHYLIRDLNYQHDAAQSLIPIAKIDPLATVTAIVVM
ncbi:MAG: hypothetical protein AAF399_24805 [Bacteroidota bacterium]